MRFLYVQSTALLIFFFTITSSFAEQHHFEICGTGDSQDLLTKLADTFMANHPGITITVPNSIGSSGGIRKVAREECELGRVARKIKQKERKYNLSYKAFAFSPIVFITNTNVPIEDISTKQIIGILNGTIANWQEIKGNNSPIYIANREQGDSSRSVLENNIPDLKKFSSWAGKVIYTTNETVETVVRHENTISYVPLAMTKEKDVNVLMFNGVTPTPDNVVSAKYPLVIELGLVWKDTLKHPVKEFVDFISSRSAQAVIDNSGAIRVK